MVQKWFKEAKLGIFIHWGIYSVNGITESWSFADGSISYDDYMKQLDGFTASKYDPKKWAKLFKATGANYAVLTTKHHDGVALFDTKHTDLTVSSKTPAGRDLVKSYCEAMQDEGIESGLYFTNTDWSDID
ncbi:MAG: alpha-L-fucosidase, partial [Oscillospiraceae bacterium]